MSLHQKINRRTALAGLLTSWAVLNSKRAIAEQYEPIVPIQLGSGLEIRDYRLFPSQDVMRFIVEIHNTTDYPVDTPSVGLTWPQQDDSNKFGWATPISPVLHAHSSDCLIGVAPVNINSDLNWGNPHWVLCDQLQTSNTERIEGWDFEFFHSTEVMYDTRALTTITVTNHNDEVGSNLLLQGLVWDANERVCGALLPVSLSKVAPGQSSEVFVNLLQDHRHIANAFTLIDSVIGTDTSFTIQPRTSQMNPGCKTVFPWNRSE